MGDILTGIAGKHALKPVISPALVGIAILQLDQANESEIDLLTRLAKRFETVATIWAGTLILAPIDSGETPSGIALPMRHVTRASGVQHRYGVADRESYTGVPAN